MATIAEIIDYYDKSAHGIYARWGAGTGAIHFGFFDTPNAIGVDCEPEQVVSLHQTSLLRTTHKVIEAAELTASDLAVDIGCGTGHLVCAVAAMGITCIGVNIAQDQINTAARLRNRLGLTQTAIFIHADFTHTRLPKETATKAIFLESLCHSPAKPQTLAETARLLKPGGKIVIADYYATSSHHLESQGIQTVNTGWKIQIAQIDTFLNNLREVGFTSPNIWKATPHMQPSFNLAAASAQAHSGETAAPEVVDHRLATIEFAQLMSQGVLGYYFISAIKS